MAHRRHHGPGIGTWLGQCPQPGLGHNPDPEPGQLGQPGQCLRSRGLAEDHQQRLWQLGLDEDVEGAAARAGEIKWSARPSGGTPWGLGRHDLDQAWRPLSEGAQGLPPDQRLRAAAADPAAQPAVGRDHRLVAWLGGRGRLAPDHRGQHAGRAGGGVVGQQPEQVVGYSVTPLARRAAQTLSEVTGMSMLVMP